MTDPVDDRRGLRAPAVAATAALSRRGRESRGPEPGAAAFRGSDRRRRPTQRLSPFAFGRGRRRHVRRSDERAGSFVDRYDPRLLVLAGWVALMNIADSAFTLVHLQAGGRELNPVADAMLMTGRIGFVACKSVLIGVALLVLCLHVNFPLARIGLWISAAAYTLLVVYHLSLFRVA